MKICAVEECANEHKHLRIMRGMKLSAVEEGAQ
jgi:hypothetical protein